MGKENGEVDIDEGTQKPDQWCGTTGRLFPVYWLIFIPRMRGDASMITRKIAQQKVAALIAEGEQLAAQALIEHCRNRIAGYKKPKYVMFVDALPRNSSGKVLKYQLKAGFVAP